ncbi:glycosyltransferase [Emticicia sp. 21SJ11W-3]|uniref:glycosyltransferase n=1 Tax=Emticicia sp. 21SJ11W-3 TaxID=2916755 RepID=UPI0020A149A1|nr:glycosyltransferase [Emticicia sp. 21SJ11W-3]UTA66861.1 glycosyltransferase [Emticicia sp. 21SJ11W-3]
MIRILHVIGGMDRAGAETMVMNIYRNIDRTRIQFDFIYFKAKACDYDEEILSLGGKIFRIVEGNSFKRIYSLYRFLKHNSQYQVIHAHTLLNIGFCFLAANLAGVPIRIAHSHSITNASDNSLANRIYQQLSIFLIKKYSTNAIACSTEAAEFLFPENKKALVLYNSIDIDQYFETGKTHKDFLRETFLPGSNSRIYVQIGRLENVKNHAFSLQIMYVLKNKKIDFHFFIIGQGTLDSFIRNEVSRLGLSGNVTMLGIRDDVPQLMAGADVMLMPSLYEGLPMVLIESQCIGLPALISDNVPADVDMGVSLVKKLSLSDTPEEWAEVLFNIKREAPKQQNIEILRSKGLDIQDAARIYTDLYLQKINTAN